MQIILSFVALSISLLANAAPPKPQVVAPVLTTQLFVSKNQNFCLTATDNQDGAAVTTAPCTSSSTPNNEWVVTNGGPGTGTITIFGDKCLDVPNGTNQDGKKLQIFSCSNNGNKNQQWTVSNDLTIKWAGTNKCLDNTGGALTAGGNPTQIWTCSKNNINQKWLPSSLDATGVAPGGSALFFIPRKATNDFGCLTAASNTDGAAVEYQNCDFTDTQSWALSAGSPPQTSTDKGAVGTVKVFGNKCLTVPGGNNANGVKLQVSTCTNNNANQKWTVNGDGTITWAGKNKCVDLTNGSQTFGNKAQTWGCSATNVNQIWFAVAL